MTSTLHLQQASMSWRDTDRQVKRDLRAIFAREAHAIGFTEVYHDLDLLEAAAKRAGYHPPIFDTETGKAETVIAVREDLTVIGGDGELVNPPEKGKPPSGGHSARYATWANFEFDSNEVFYVEAHWVTGNTKSRNAKRQEMSETIARLIREHAKGNAVGFWAGDTNEDDQENNDGSVIYTPLQTAGLVTCWDELKVWPPTHKGKRKATIDVIGSFEGDLRVSLQAAQVWPWGESDHGQVSAWYDIRPERVKPPEPVEHPCPACGNVHLGVVPA